MPPRMALPMPTPTEADRCPHCREPYTAADVVGLGILRARPAHLGGPLVEYRCAACRRVLVLVPHGDSRYAPPGAPPPPTPSAANRATNRSTQGHFG